MLGRLLLGTHTHRVKHSWRNTVCTPLPLPLLLSVTVTTATNTQIHIHTHLGLCLPSHTCPYPLATTSPLPHVSLTHAHTHTHLHTDTHNVVVNDSALLTLAALGAHPSERLLEVLKSERSSEVKDRQHCQRWSCSALHSSPHIPPPAEALIKLFWLYIHPHRHTPCYTHTPACYRCRCLPMTCRDTAVLLTLPFWLLKQTLTIWERKCQPQLFYKITHFTSWVPIKMPVIHSALFCDNGVRIGGGLIIGRIIET